MASSIAVPDDTPPPQDCGGRLRVWRSAILAPALCTRCAKVSVVLEPGGWSCLAVVDRLCPVATPVRGDCSVPSVVRCQCAMGLRV